MKFLYEFVRNVAEYNDSLGAYMLYFEGSGNGFLYQFLLCLGIAVIIGTAFYFFIGRTSFLLSTLTVWLVLLLVVMASSAITGKYIAEKYLIGNQLRIKSTKQPVYIEKAFQDKYGRLTVEQKGGPEGTRLVKARSDLAKTIKDEKSEVIKRLILTNAFVAALLFFLVSLLFKNGSIHAQLIPIKYSPL